MALYKLLLILLFPAFAAAQTPMSKLLRKRAGGCSDADATKYITAVTNAGGSLTAGEQTAVCELVVAKKAAGTWTKDLAFYPMLGGTAASVVINLKDTSTYRGTLYNSPTISSTGIDWNGTTQYMSTTFDLSTLASQDNQHIMYYSMENVNEPAIPMGGGTGFTATDLELYNSTLYSFNGTSGSNYATVGLGTTAGVFINTRTTSTDFYIYQDGTQIATKSATASANPGVLLYIGATAGGGNVAAYFTTMKCGMAAFGNGYTSGEVAAETTALNTFKTATGK